MYLLHLINQSTEISKAFEWCPYNVLQDDKNVYTGIVSQFPLILNQKDHSDWSRWHSMGK